MILLTFIYSDSPDSTEVSLENFLAFVTGADQLPAAGFDITPKICFCDEDQYPVALTCLLTLTLSRRID